MKIFKGFNKLRDFHVGGFLICVMIFIAGSIFGYANSISNSSSNSNTSNSNTRIFQSTISLIGGSGFIAIFIFFINQYVMESIKEEKEKLEREGEDRYRKELEFEFLSIISKELQDISDINFLFFCEDIRNLNAKSQFKFQLKLEDYFSKLQYRTEAIEGLNKGFTRDENNLVPFSRLVGEACHHALEIQTKEVPEWAEDFYIDIQAYLKAWLTCSIRHGIPIQIEPFFQHSLEGDGKKYPINETYIKAIKYIKDLVDSSNQDIQFFFKESGSRKIVSEYLSQLIQILNKKSVNN